MVEYLNLLQSRLRLVSSSHEEMLDDLPRLDKLTSGKKGCFASTRKKTVENTEETWTIVKSQQPVEKTTVTYFLRQETGQTGNRAAGQPQSPEAGPMGSWATGQRQQGRRQRQQGRRQGKQGRKQKKNKEETQNNNGEITQPKGGGKEHKVETQVKQREQGRKHR